jgi:hypothetical protein
MCLRKSERKIKGRKRHILRREEREREREERDTRREKDREEKILIQLCV